MREILFRGKRLKDGEWIEGDLVHDRRVDTNEPVFCIWYFDSAGKPRQEDVDPETVGQYTGMRDCMYAEEYPEGLQIFEGDIVSFVRYNALGYRCSRIGYVAFYDKLPVFYIMATTGDAWDWCDCDEIKVIGNIHDNPELLKEGGEE